MAFLGSGGVWGNHSQEPEVLPPNPSGEREYQLEEYNIDFYIYHERYLVVEHNPENVIPNGPLGHKWQWVKLYIWVVLAII